MARIETAKPLHCRLISRGDEVVIRQGGKDVTKDSIYFSNTITEALFRRAGGLLQWPKIKWPRARGGRVTSLFGVRW